MPKISRISLNNRVTDGLHDAVTDLIPEEYFDNPVVKWVVAHDSLARSKAGGDSVNDSPWMAAVAEYIASEVEPKVSFYFGSLFHIARMRSVSFYCKQNVELLNSGRNLERSATNLVNLSNDRFGIENALSSESADTLLRKLSGMARENAIQQERLATHWWEIWLKEAGVLKNATNSFDESWRAGESRRKRPNRQLFRSAIDLLRICNEESLLLESMKKEGVRFKGVSAHGRSGLMGLGGIPFLFAMMAGNYEGDDRFFMHELEHMVHDWARSEREQRIQPQVEIALDMLKSKYGNRNPFDDYLPLNRPADSKLRDLCFEHRLPNSENSPWRANWAARIENQYIGSKHNPLLLPVKDKLEWAVRLADSVIKQNVCDDILPTEDWNRFVQRLFEDYCVKELGKGAGGANAKEDKEVWTEGAFSAFIRELTERVKRLGYEVSAPEDFRLRALLEKAKDGYVSKGDW